MNEDTKEALQLAIQILRRTMIDNGVSMAVSKSGELHFFDTAIYLNEKRFDGIKVNMQKLVEE